MQCTQFTNAERSLLIYYKRRTLNAVCSSINKRRTLNAVCSSINKRWTLNAVCSSINKRRTWNAVCLSINKRRTLNAVCSASNRHPRQPEMSCCAEIICSFVLFIQNRDGKLSVDEFREGSKCDPWIVQALSMELPGMSNNCRNNIRSQHQWWNITFFVVVVGRRCRVFGSVAIMSFQRGKQIVCCV